LVGVGKMLRGFPKGKSPISCAGQLSHQSTSEESWQGGMSDIGQREREQTGNRSGLSGEKGRVSGSKGGGGGDYMGNKSGKGHRNVFKLTYQKSLNGKPENIIEFLQEVEYSCRREKGKRAIATDLK